MLVVTRFSAGRAGPPRARCEAGASHYKQGVRAHYCDFLSAGEPNGRRGEGEACDPRTTDWLKWGN